MEEISTMPEPITPPATEAAAQTRDSGTAAAAAVPESRVCAAASVAGGVMGSGMVEISSIERPLPDGRGSVLTEQSRDRQGAVLRTQALAARARASGASSRRLADS